MTIMVASILLKPTLVMFYGNKLFGVIAKFMQKNTNGQNFVMIFLMDISIKLSDIVVVALVS